MFATQNTVTAKGFRIRYHKGFFNTLLCSVLLGFSPVQLVAASYQQGTGPVGGVSFEAEDFDANVSQGGKIWTNSYPSGYSGSSALTAASNSGVNNNTGYVTQSPRLDYVVNFAKIGVHYVWIRGAGPSGSDDSLHVGLDGAAVSSSSRISNFTKSLGWTNTRMGGSVATINVTSTGEHTLNVWMREDGTIIDKIVLVTSSSYVPTGAGPNASARSSSGSTTESTSNEPVATLSKSSINFGSQGVGGISDPSPVRITNSGSAPLYISSITTSGRFIQTNNCGGAVSVDGSCVINVEFVPTSTGTFNGSLRISSNASSSNVIGLTGTGSDGTQSSSGSFIDPNAPEIKFYQDFSNGIPRIYTSQDLRNEWNGTWDSIDDDSSIEIVSDPANSGRRNVLQIFYPAGKIWKGAVWQAPLEKSDELYFAYDIMFDSNFEFTLGGKLPGLMGGPKVYSGSNDAIDGSDGWMGRMMWEENGAVKNLMSYMDQNNKYGSSFRWAYGSEGQRYFVPGKWHRVQMHYKMNTVGKKDGLLEAWFDGKLAFTKNIQYRTVNTVKIDEIAFSTFYGGGNSAWAPVNDHRVYFDNFVVSTKLIP